MQLVTAPAPSETRSAGGAKPEPPRDGRPSRRGAGRRRPAMPPQAPRSHPRGPRGTTAVTCRGCSEQLRVPVGLRQRNIRKGWVQHRWCRPCKLANDAYYARENAAQATPVTSNPEFRTVSPAAPATSDGETSPANAVAPRDELRTGDELRAASPATPVASGVKPLEMNWLQAAKGSLRQAEH